MFLHKTLSTTFVLVAALFTIIMISVLGSSSGYPCVSAQQVTFETLGMTVTLKLLPNASAPSQQGDDTCEIILRSKTDADKYLALAASYGAMTGRLLGCQFPSAGSLTTTCSEMHGDGYDADSVASTTYTLVSSNNTVADGAVIVLQIPLSSFGVTKEQGLRRWIFARGEWENEDGKSEMGDHGAVWSEIGIDLYKGEFIQYQGTPFTFITIAATWIFTLLLALVGAALKQCHQRSGRKVTTLLVGITWATMIGMFCVICFEAHSEYRKIYAPAPIARSIGAGIGYIFALMFLPVNRYLNVGYLAGSSYDRFINFHVVGGWLLFLTMLIHMIWFFVVYSQQSGGAFVGIMFSWADGVIPVLPAFLGFLAFLVFFIVAALRSVVSYYWFRVSHYCFPVFLILFTIHWPPLGVCYAPGLILYIVDVFLRFYRPTVEDPKITKLEVEEKSRVVKMVVTLNDKNETWTRTSCHAGQYVFFSITEISEIPHPFTFIDSRYVEENKTAELTFYIRASGTFTENLYLLAKKAPESLLNKSGLLRQFTGPVGCTEVDVEFPDDVVFVSGGIGVTATQGLLYSLVDKIENSSNSGGGKTTTTTSSSKDSSNKKRSIHFIWVVREPELAKMILPHIEECSLRLQSITSEIISFKATIYVTQQTNTKKVQDEQQTNQQDVYNSKPLVMGAADVLNKQSTSSLESHDENIQFIFGKRPDESDLIPHRKNENQEGENSDDRRTIGYFCCGPIPSDSIQALRLKVQCYLAMKNAEIIIYYINDGST